MADKLSQPSTPSLSSLANGGTSQKNVTMNRRNIETILKTALSQRNFQEALEQQPGAPTSNFLALTGYPHNSSLLSSESNKSLNAHALADPYNKYRSKSYGKADLAFTEAELERGFQAFHATNTLRPFRFSIALSMMAIAAIYIYALVVYPQQEATWLKYYADKPIKQDDMANNMQSYCPKGYYCDACPDTILCQPYLMWADLLFMAICLLWGALVLAASFLMSKEQYVRWYNWMSMAFMVVIACVGIVTRFFVIDREHNPLTSAILLILFLQGGYNGIQMRFAYGTFGLFTTFAVWWGINAYRFENGNKYFSQALVVGLILLANALIACHNLYRAEVTYRDQYLRYVYSNKVNIKLVNQLRALQKSYSAGVVDFESPLEKAIAIVRSVLADPSLSPEIFHSLEITIQLLNSSQLFAPDFESQLMEVSDATGQTIRVDEDQKAWLFSEVTKRRADLRGSQGRGRHRRKSSVMPDNIDVPPLPENAISFTSRNNSLMRGMITVTETTSNEYLEPVTEDMSPKTEVSLTTNRDPFSFAMAKLSDKREKEDPIQSTLYAKNITQIARLQGPKSASSYNIALIQTQLAQLTEWNWKLFEFADACPGGKPLFILTWHLFDILGLFDEFNISVEKFNAFFWEIQSGYRDLPYHNSLHAADVVHAVNYFSNFDQVSSLLSPLEQMALIFAAAIHDFDHPGVNSNFLVTTGNPLAILYNDKSVLECYHLSAAFQLLLKPEFNFLADLPKAEWQAFREIVIDMVLATDLSQHYATLSQFKTKVQTAFNPAESKEDRILLMKMLIKCADVSNPTKDFSIYIKWTNNVLDEWRMQGDQEKKLNIPVSPFMDRENSNVLLSSQVGFIDFIIVPMYETLHQNYLNIPVPMAELDKNRRHWAKLKEVKDKSAASTPQTTQTMFRRPQPGPQEESSKSSPQGTSNLNRKNVGDVTGEKESKSSHSVKTDDPLTTTVQRAVLITMDKKSPSNTPLGSNTES